MLNVRGFLHIEKAGGTAITSILRGVYGYRHCDLLYSSLNARERAAEELELAKAIYPRLQSVAGHGLYPEHLPSLRFFTFLRNPALRMISHYQHYVEKKDLRLSFADWVNELEMSNFQVRKLSPNESVDDAIRTIEKHFFFVGLVEDFERSMVSLCRILGISPVPSLTAIGITKNSHLSHNFRDRLLKDKNVIRILEKTNKADDELYNTIQKKFYSGFCQREPFEYDGSCRSYSLYKLHMNRIFRNVIYRPLWSLANRQLSLPRTKHKKST